jgi:starch synthase
VGGLHDTVTDSETGFVFVDKRVKSFNDTLKRALQTYPDRERWENLQRAGMRQDFSWSRSAQKYLELYKRLIEMVSAPASAGEAYPARSGLPARRIREANAVNGEAK